MRRRSILIVVLLLLVGVGGYWLYNNSGRAGTAARNVQTAKVTRGSLSAAVSSAGTVAARAQVALNFSTSGTVKQVYVNVGDVVKQGQVLAEADPTTLQFALANAQLAFNQAQIKYDQTAAGPSASDLTTARSNVDTAQANYDAAVRKAGLNDQQLVMLQAALDKSALALQSAQSDYDQAVADHLNDLTSVTLALHQAKLDYESAQASYNIQVAALDDTAVRSAASSLAAAKANLLTLQTTPTPQDLQSAEAQLEQAKLALQEAQYNMRGAQLIAPIAGTVTQVNIDEFSSTSAGNPAIQLSDLNTLQVTVNIAEVDIGRVKVGQDVNFTLDALLDIPALTGKVEQVALVGTTTSGVVNYPVVLTLTSADPSLIKTGMTANVSIVVDKRENVLLVPNKAIKTQAGKRVVQVETAAGTVATPVTIGLQGDSYSEVLSGLNEGDVVVISTTTTTTTTGGGGPGGIGIPGVFGR